MTRFLSSMPGYMYGQYDDHLYANLFVCSTATVQLSNGEVEIVQQTNYPWDVRTSREKPPCKH